MQLRLEDVDEMTAAVRPIHGRLCQAAPRLSDADLRAPSLLPGWTRGHVLTHLARNADAQVGMLGGLLRGESVPQYPGGAEQRAADIEAGAHRPTAETVADLCRSIQELEAVWDRMTPDVWAQEVTMLGGVVPAWRTAWSRWREVEIHWVDLDADVTPLDWSAQFVELAMAEEAGKLGPRLPPQTSVFLDATDSGNSWRAGPDDGPSAYAVEGPTPWLLAWLLGRLADPAKVLTAPNGIPDLPAGP